MPSPGSTSRRRRQIAMLESGYELESLRRVAQSLNAASRRSAQIIIDAQTVLSAASVRVTDSRRLLNTGGDGKGREPLCPED